MKQSLTLSALFVCMSTMLVAQQPDAFDTQYKVYKNAMRFYDLQAASNALYNMIAIKPEREDLNDSLAFIYFAGERYGQAYLLGEEILKKSPEKTDILEVVAVSKQSLGLTKEALANFESLYQRTKSLYYLYQVATLQYGLQRYGECIASLDIIIASPDAATQKINIRNPNNTSQEVPMAAAALNVKGICASELNQLEAAKENFNKALTIMPDFRLAKSNLEALNKDSKKVIATPQTGTAPKSTTTTTTPAKSK